MDWSNFQTVNTAFCKVKIHRGSRASRAFKQSQDINQLEVSVFGDALCGKVRLNKVLFQEQIYLQNKLLQVGGRNILWRVLISCQLLKSSADFLALKITGCKSFPVRQKSDELCKLYLCQQLRNGVVLLLWVVLFVCVF